jgi:hypothetical protein
MFLNSDVMTFLRTAFVFAVKHRLVSHRSSKQFCSVASSTSVGEEGTKDCGNNYDDSTKNIDSGHLDLPNTIRQYAARDQKRHNFTKDISRGPGLKDFVINSSLQPVQCDSVPYIRNTTIKGLNRKGKPIIYRCWFGVTDRW